MKAGLRLFRIFMMLMPTLILLNTVLLNKETMKEVMKCLKELDMEVMETFVIKEMETIEQNLSLYLTR